MLSSNFAQYIGHPLAEVEDDIRFGFFGTITVFRPGEDEPTDLRPSRLQVYVNEYGLVTRIVHG